MTDTLAVACIPPHAAPEVWAQAGPMLARALRFARGEYQAHHVMARLATGQWLLWVAEDAEGALRACCVTEVVKHDIDAPAHLWVLLGAGTDAPEAVAAMWPHIRTHARRIGCTEVRFMGRLGWGRRGALPPEFQRTHEVWSCTVEGA